MLTVLGGLAEFERELIRARTGEGRARAKARGVKLGRKPKLTPHQKREALERRQRGEETHAETGRRTPITNNVEAMRRAIEEAGIEFVFDQEGRPAGSARSWCQHCPRASYIRLSREPLTREGR
jgi:hypothetical protein